LTFQEIAGIGAYIIASLGGGGGIVFGLSNHLGKVWADRALEKQRQENARILESLRQEHATRNLELTHQLGLLTEKAKSALQITTLEQIRFSKASREACDSR
jgi:hypothetical protein